MTVHKLEDDLIASMSASMGHLERALKGNPDILQVHYQQIATLPRHIQAVNADIVAKRIEVERLQAEIVEQEEKAALLQKNLDGSKAYVAIQNRGE